MHEAARQVIDHIRAGGTALVLPIGRETEHEMVDDELALLAEQIGECAASVRPLEYVFLLERHHRQRTPLGAQCVALTGQLLLFDEQALAGGGPFVSRYDPWFRHGLSLRSYISDMRPGTDPGAAMIRMPNATIARASGTS